MRKILLLPLLFGLLLVSGSFTDFPSEKSAGPEEIHWYTFQQAFDMNKKNPKKIFIDVYTDWCGWCKKMEASTFKDATIVALMNKYYYAVKLNAEMKDTVKMDSVRFVNLNPGVKGATHQLASALLGNKMAYPTLVLLNEKFAMLSQPIPGFKDAESLEPILVFLGEELYTKESWDDFSKNYTPQTKAK